MGLDHAEGHMLGQATDCPLLNEPPQVEQSKEEKLYFLGFFVLVILIGAIVFFMNNM